MIYTLENENIRVVASSNGGELHSIKKINDETEYLWNGDERYWKYHAPVLFPIVGKVNGGKYKIDGIEYEFATFTIFCKIGTNAALYTGGRTSLHCTAKPQSRHFTDGS